MMNKKGVDYAALLVVVVIICMAALYVKVVHVEQAKPVVIGVHQGPLLDVNPQVRLYESFVQLAAQSAFNESIVVLEERPSVVLGISVAQSSCQELLNSKEDPQKLVVSPDFAGGFSKVFNVQFNKYVQEFTQLKKENEAETWIIPLDNMVVSILANQVVGFAVKPTVFPITNRVVKEKDASVLTMGVATFHQNFKIQTDYAFEEWTAHFDTLGVIAQKCSVEKRVQDCLSQTVPKTWFVGETKEVGRYEFTVPVGTKNVCYALWLPGQSG